MQSLQEVERIGDLIFGIGADSLGLYAECHSLTGERLDMHGPLTQRTEIRRILGDMKAYWLSRHEKARP